MIKIIKYVILSMMLIQTSYAMPLPDSYEYNQCELVAKDFQKELGGSLVFIQPLQDNGAYDLGDYKGHFLNAVYVKGNKKIFYIDYYTQRIMGSKEEVLEWYEMMNDKKAEMWILDESRPPFSINWHYS